VLANIIRNISCNFICNPKFKNFIKIVIIRGKDKFWILEEDAKRVGMMNFKDNNYTINLKRKDLVAHSANELKNMGIEFVVRDLTHGGHLEVMGYPTDQEEVFNVKEIENFPTFTKKFTVQ
jgi:regulatory protein YycI of two-component signal transduction system YycFG